mmetsp:Transcript_45456/g.81794  ORF Transcript_45456/g.81794 Transcript_45456/m.81794 type:complete len:686 (-) Transcript_45456:51-2108(-)|eukprot:CAMPEP_0197650750 /NCGR_PEP_ID=MMETSP1338-20131121/31132_1 /TAXON_ID=43686 ORGANISM="Pelagodinium beii, Strain RCC1491" /NCGR_SAMPLE_ID=MMETSP1338 /ASSEMBLY_ACC=CAM_ASM_000754 /LENGTH=685 /DNA_ID=CAMNT_0043225223 /DNA_START=49 /DNA_END=2106 /DNA_ORIENTATION=-
MARRGRGCGQIARTLSALGSLVVPLSQASLLDEYSFGRELQSKEWQQGVSCDDLARWSQMRWMFLSYQEREAWTTLGWTEPMWDAAHPVPTTTAFFTTSPEFGSRRLRGFAETESAAGSTVAEQPERPNATADEGDEYAFWRRMQEGIMTSTSTPTTTSTTQVPMTETLCYQDLTSVQQDSVRILGYSISSWSVCKNPDCDWPPGIPLPTATCLEVRSWLGTSLFYRSWADLEPAKVESLMLLGWSFTRWSNWDYPLAYAKLWSELLPRQQEAALFLGYTAQAWEMCEKSAPCIERLELLEAGWHGILWKQMQQPFQDRLRELGYNEERWTNGDAPTLQKDYVDLTPPEKVSVRLAGYVSDTWDGCPLTQCEERFSYVKRKYSGLRWMQMSVAQRRAWQLLGHTESLWTEGGMMNTLALQLTWEELSQEQRVQAQFLGHSQGTWQGCNTKWGTVTSNQTTVEDEGFISTSIERTVRARMTIRRPFAEVSGNVYGAAVAQLPSSFIKVFESAVARALFCNNPPLSEDPKTYIDMDGNPLCILKDQYQTQKHRVKIMVVVEGSIIVDFFLARNQTGKELTAPTLFESLKRMLTSETSPLCQDMEFGKFAKVAEVQEIPLSHLSEDALEDAQVFETMRQAYGEETACLLLRDAREGPIKCPTATASGGAHDSKGIGFLFLMLLAMALL